MDRLAVFFQILRADEVLLFTTFTLDEAVLVALLTHNDVPKRQRIVVFHDIMRHRCPGILKSYYPNAMVYSVELIQNYSNKCPVFHSKIWARVTGGTINRLIITSSNLSQYHLVSREGSGTLESVHYIEAGLICGESGGDIFNKKLLSPEPSLLEKGLHRIKMKPHSLVIDIRNIASILVTDKPLIENIKALGTPELCAAPFVCDGAITKHLAPSSRFRVYQGEHAKSRLTLHAKVMIFPNCMALGSVNWTAQAMGSIGKPINHETLLIAKRDDIIVKQLHGFPARNLGNTDSKVPPGDPDETGQVINWIEERKIRIAAPEQALLFIADGRASITLVGMHKKVKFVRLQCVDGDTSILVKIVNNIIFEPLCKSDRLAFALIISSGSVVLHGLVNSSSVPCWKIELNYQHFWSAFEENVKSRSHSKSNRGESSPNQSQKIHFSDVRDIRRSVLGTPDQASGFVAFNRWLSNNGAGGLAIPTWCLKLVEQMQKDQS